MLQGLAEAHVRFVVIGGVAANVHGSPRITNDLDVCYDPAPVNIDRLAAVLTGWQAYPRGVEPGLPFVMDSRALRTNPILTLVTTEGAVDVLDRVEGVGDYGRVREASQDAVWGAVTFRVIGLDALIAAKRATGRRRDQEALLELEALRELKRKVR